MCWIGFEDSCCVPLDADYEEELRLGGHVVSAFFFAQAVEADLLALGIAIFFHVGLGTLEDDASLFFCSLSSENLLASHQQILRLGLGHRALLLWIIQTRKMVN